jgi:hypothetical protein
LRPRLAGTAALFAAHLFLRASESRFRPSGVIPPFRLAFAGVAGASSDFFAAHLALRASERRRRPSGVMPPLRVALRAPAEAGVADVTLSAPAPSTSRRAVRARSIAVRCCSSFLIISFRLFAIVCPCRPIESTNTNHNAFNYVFLLRDSKCVLFFLLHRLRPSRLPGCPGDHSPRYLCYSDNLNESAQNHCTCGCNSQFRPGRHLRSGRTNQHVRYQEPQGGSMAPAVLL